MQRGGATSACYGDFPKDTLFSVAAETSDWTGHFVFSNQSCPMRFRFSVKLSKTSFQKSHSEKSLAQGTVCGSHSLLPFSSELHSLTALQPCTLRQCLIRANGSLTSLCTYRYSDQEVELWLKHSASLGTVSGLDCSPLQEMLLQPENQQVLRAARASRLELGSLCLPPRLSPPLSTPDSVS